MREAERALTTLRESALALIGDVEVLTREQVGPDGAEAVHALADLVRRQSYQVVVCGEFKRGKSSLLNAIVGRQQLFPTGQELTTATVMSLRWGPRPRAVARTLTAAGETTQDVPLDELATYVSTAPGGQSWRVTQLEVELPHERLASGIVLVDTPGIGGADEVHSAITTAFLPNADAVVIVLSAVQPATASELEFTKRALAQRPAAVFALAMADKSPDIGQRVEASRARLSGYLGVPPEELNIVPVSATEAWYARRAGDRNRLVASGIPRLENEIWTTLVAQAGVRRLRSTVDTLTRLLEDASAPVASELTALAGPDELAAVLAELDANEQAARTVGTDLADRGQLEQDFTSLVTGIERGFQDGIDQVLAEIERAAAADAEPVTTQALAELARTAADAAAKAFTALREAAVTVAREWERRTAQPLRVLRLTPQDDLDLPGPPKTVRQRLELTTAIKEGAPGGAALSTQLAAAGGILGLLGGFSAPVGMMIGGLIGQLVGLLGSVIDQARAANAQSRARLAGKYAGQLVERLTDYRSDTLTRIEDTQQELLQHLKLQMRTLNQAQLTTIAQARRRIQALVTANTATRAARTAELRRQREVITGYATRLRDLADQVCALERESAYTGDVHDGSRR